MTKYVPSRHYLHVGAVAAVLGAVSVWGGWNWALLYLAAAGFFLSAAILFYLARRPAVEVHDSHLAIGRRTISWMDIRSLDRIGWLSPLIVRITLFDNSRILLIYPGDVDSSNSLLRHLRRSAREALIDGRTYQDFWGEGMPRLSEPLALASPRYRLLRPEDEAEVERLYQRLKAVRHLDPDSSGDEK